MHITSLLAALSLPLSAFAATCKPTPHKNISTTSTGSSNVRSGWYAGWLGSTYPPDTIAWSNYNSVKFSFATTTNDPSKIALDSDSAALLPTFVSAAHNAKVNASLSIGGWTGSQYFSLAVTSQNRSTFVKAVVGLATQYNLDGIDFDWEYPGVQGIGCNVISDDDSANFLAFLQELKQDSVGSKLVLSAAVGLEPFHGLSDVSGFADVLDHIAIMDYDVWGSFSSNHEVGPNAPLADACASSEDQEGSATSALNAWKTANFPANKIALAVAAYGHSFNVSNSNALTSSGVLASFPPFDANNPPLGNSDVPNAPPSTDVCGNSVGVSGTFDFESLISDGYLTTNGSAAPGMDYRFDNCSQTPYVYNPNTLVMISYDDARSFAAKAAFIEQNGLAGFSVWHVSGDSNDILLDAITGATSK